jgi:hypothetical protein
VPSLSSPCIWPQQQQQQQPEQKQACASIVAIVSISAIVHPMICNMHLHTNVLYWYHPPSFWARPSIFLTYFPLTWHFFALDLAPNWLQIVQKTAKKIFGNAWCRE